MANDKAIEIKIKIGNSDIELTLDEAREIWAVLNSMFSGPVVYPYYPQLYYPCYPDMYTPGFYIGVSNG